MTSGDAMPWQGGARRGMKACMISGLHHATRQERVLYGVSAVEVVPREIARLGARRPFLITSASPSRPGAIAERLGKGLAGQFTGIREHTPRDTVIAG
ncbi:MAG TPA: hypothetical protein VKT70_03770, partial [Stellaceae bacterium]|nr:hypothetical protein [Stellaceae bacterium]